MKSRWPRQRWALLAAAVVLLAAGCMRPGGGIPTPTTRPSNGGGGTPTTMDHGHDGNMPGMMMGYGPTGNHAPTQAQINQMKDFVAKTRAYMATHWRTRAEIQADTRMHFVGIGDGSHFSSKTCRQDKGVVKKKLATGAYGEGYDTFDWTCPESLVTNAITNTVTAVMYQLPDKMGFNDIPDMGGNLTMWHGHPLCFQSNNPDQDGYYRIGGAEVGNSGTCSGGVYRGVSPMIHVWIKPNATGCGAFAGLVQSEGTCQHVID